MLPIAPQHLPFVSSVLLVSLRDEAEPGLSAHMIISVRVQPLCPHLLGYRGFQDVTGTVKTQPVLSAPNSRLRKQDHQARRLFFFGMLSICQEEEEEEEEEEDRTQGEDERESLQTCLHLQGLLT
ncbi:unnamed protein product [Pleuronectes platessa]|uniref:Uncharacterized protein n=1 Tax=Pleuronectes platessa TaxID=8262 RepID=A0A9N7UCQ9_PLEPL|nr:unnamed protein product [Pleuronectes platessa]